MCEKIENCYNIRHFNHVLSIWELMTMPILYHQLHKSNSCYCGTYYVGYINCSYRPSKSQEFNVLRSETKWRILSPLSHSPVIIFLFNARIDFSENFEIFIIILSFVLQSRDIFIDYTLRQILLCSVKTNHTTLRCNALHCTALCYITFFTGCIKSHALSVAD